MSRSGELFTFIQELVDNNYDDMTIINETRVRFGVRLTERYLDTMREEASLDSTYDEWN